MRIRYSRRRTKRRARSVPPALTVKVRTAAINALLDSRPITVTKEKLLILVWKKPSWVETRTREQSTITT